MANIRSCISFQAKLLERVDQTRLQFFFDHSDLVPKSQSAYWKYHSTATALVKVFNELLRFTCLFCAYSDVTAALDTVDHQLLMIFCLERPFGLSYAVLQWFRSYLTGRTFPGAYSTPSFLCVVRSFPQGSSRAILCVYRSMLTLPGNTM